MAADSTAALFTVHMDNTTVSADVTSLSVIAISNFPHHFVGSYIY